MSKDIWAVVPLKVTTGSKQRLSAALPPALRQRLAIAMFGDVLAALTASPELAGIVAVTLDPEGTAMARAAGARIVTEGALDGHTGAVTAAARLLAAEGRGTMLALPGDLPLLSPSDITVLTRAHDTACTIVPGHDGRGSNAVMLTPPDALPLQFGNDSFVPHMARATALGLNPRKLVLPNIGLDIDTPEELAMFRAHPSQGRAWALLAQEAP
ncbi:2-phospho-L-lactate guanylyltransferase [Roseomonas sp. BN140053]|uniref:2-phospho-L-lactate guanylyltransferase n=1 Tax=Roseomonas sp. BN140053 TaxID=3391898 RepID=UPI0039ECB39B